MQVIGIVGLTASGKSFIASKLASTGRFYIINADSQQVYNYLTILSNVPENLNNHFLYKFIEYSENIKKFSTADWCENVYSTIQSNDVAKIPILVGGTGMYFKALQEGLANIPKIQQSIMDYVKLLTIPELQKISQTDFQDRRRLERACGIFLETGKYIWQFYCSKEKKNQDIADEYLNNNQYLKDNKFIMSNLKLYAITPSVKEIWENIENRLDNIIDPMISQVSEFGLNKTVDMIGYDEIVKFLSHQINLAQLKELIIFKTRQYAKRQRTYIRNCLKIEQSFETAQELYQKIIYDYL